MARSRSNIGVFNDLTVGTEHYVHSDSRWLGQSGTGSDGPDFRQYEPGNVVSYAPPGGELGLYQCILEHVNRLPTNTTYWTALSSGGMTQTMGEDNNIPDYVPGTTYAPGSVVFVAAGTPGIPRVYTGLIWGVPRINNDLTTRTASVDTSVAGNEVGIGPNWVTRQIIRLPEVAVAAPLNVPALRDIIGSPPTNGTIQDIRAADSSATPPTTIREAFRTQAVDSEDGIVYRYNASTPTGTDLGWRYDSGLTVDSNDGINQTADGEISLNLNSVITAHNPSRAYEAGDTVFTEGTLGGITTRFTWEAKIATPGATSAVPAFNGQGFTEWSRLIADVGNNLIALEDEINVHNTVVQLDGSNVAIRHSSDFDDQTLLNDLATRTELNRIANSGSGTQDNAIHTRSAMGEVLDSYLVDEVASTEGVNVSSIVTDTGMNRLQVTVTSDDNPLTQLLTEIEDGRALTAGMLEVNGLRILFNGVDTEASSARDFNLDLVGFFSPSSEQTVPGPANANSGGVHVYNQSGSAANATAITGDIVVYSLVALVSERDVPQLGTDFTSMADATGIRTYSLADNSVGDAELRDGAVGTSHIASSAINPDKLLASGDASNSQVLSIQDNAFRWVDTSRAISVFQGPLRKTSQLGRLNFAGDGVTGVVDPLDDSTVTITIAGDEQNLVTREVQTVLASGTTSSTSVTTEDQNLLISLNSDYLYNAGSPARTEFVDTGTTAAFVLFGTGNIFPSGQPASGNFAAGDVISRNQDGSNPAVIDSISLNGFIVFAGTAVNGGFLTGDRIYRMEDIAEVPPDEFTFSIEGITPTGILSDTLLQDNLAQGANAQDTLNVIRGAILNAYSTFSVPNPPIIPQGGNQVLTINTNQQMSLGITSGISGAAVFSVTEVGVGGVSQTSSYDIMRPDGTSITAVTAMSGLSIAETLSAIAGAIDADPRIPTETSVVGNRLVIVATEPQNYDGTWVIEAVHPAGGDGDITFESAVEASQGGVEVLGVGSNLSVQDGVLDVGSNIGLSANLAANLLTGGFLLVEGTIANGRTPYTDTAGIFGPAAAVYHFDDTGDSGAGAWFTESTGGDRIVGFDATSINP